MIDDIASSAPSTEFRCGYIALIGPPNVGKSTLLNRLVGEKVSIATRRPQTTRHRILGIKTTPHAQMIFVDTPGIQTRYRHRLHQAMNRSALSTLHDVDVVILMMDARRRGGPETFIAERIRTVTAPVIVAINKIDTLEHKEPLLPQIELVQKALHPAEILPISARTGCNVGRLESAVMGLLPHGEALFAPDQITDKNMRFMAAEIIREKLMVRFGQEVPYQLAVDIERFEEQDSLVRLFAVIWVEHRGHKPIVVGKGGAQLKEAGMRARMELESWLNKKVCLKLWVKVKSGWSDDVRALRNLGIEE